MLRTLARTSVNRGNMKDNELPLIEVEELKEPLPNIWKMQLDAAVNQSGVENFYGDHVKVKDVIDVWDIK